MQSDQQLYDDRPAPSLVVVNLILRIQGKFGQSSPIKQPIMTSTVKTIDVKLENIRNEQK